MAVANAYGTFNPKGEEPFPIETTLANKAATSPVDAWNLLQAYRSQNQVAGQNYTSELDTQHQFAIQQLHQQLYENQLKAMTEATKTPGALNIIASSPQYRGVLGGADPSVVGGVADRLTGLQAAEQAQKGGAGAASTVAAGGVLSPAAVQGVTGLPVSGMIDPVALRVAQENSRGRMGAEAIGAAGRNAPGAKDSTVTTYGPDGVTPVTTAQTVHGAVKAPVPNPPRNRINPNTTGLTMAPAGADSAAPQAQLQATPQSPSVAAQTQQTTIQPGTITSATLASFKGTAAYADIMAAAHKNIIPGQNAGTVPHGPHGGLMGASGTEY